MEGEGDGEAFADAALILRVFDNLAANAARYAKTRVAASFRRRGDTLVLSYDELGGDYTPAVYERGAAFLYRLEQALGRETFSAAMREYYAAFAFKEAATQAFLPCWPYAEGNGRASACDLSARGALTACADKAKTQGNAA